MSTPAPSRTVDAHEPVPASEDRAVARPRLDSVDLLRGAVMVLMAIDHTRDFFLNNQFDPTDLDKTNAALFMTRWITHFCAPVFVFLAGTGAFLSASKGKPKSELSKFLVTRGVWLIVLELTIIRFGWFFDLSYGFSILQVIWAIGWSMIALAALVHLPLRFVALFGVLMIAGHNLFDGVQAQSLGLPGWLWAILHAGGPRPEGFIPLAPGHAVLAVYPLIPWIGVMAAGYAFGALLRLEPDRRRTVLIGLGAALTLAFVALRATNLYGDPAVWKPQNSALFTVLSFLNCEKYPPSLLYLLMTLGPAIMLIGLLDRVSSGPLARPLVIFGRVPLFYYILHLPLLHGAAVVLALVRYGPAAVEFRPDNLPPDYGVSLPVMYLVWLLAMLALFPLCAWFARVKQRRKDWWLSYL